MYPTNQNKNIIHLQQLNSNLIFSSSITKNLCECMAVTTTPLAAVCACSVLQMN